MPCGREIRLRHTFATMALENGMNVKVLSDMIGHISAETTLNIYSHVTDTMRTQASVKIDRKIGGTDAQMPTAQPSARKDTAPIEFTPYKPKIRKPGTGCVTMINDHLYEGRYTPTNAYGKRESHNIYAKTREECEEKLAEIEKKEAALAPKEDEKPEVEPEQEKIDEPDEPAENTEPEVIQEEADEKEDDDSGLERFSLSDIGPADEYDDISSDSHFDDDSDSGFSLNVSDAEFDDEDDSTENNSVAENDLSDDDSGEADDDEDDEPVSFKSFFKKK